MQGEIDLALCKVHAGDTNFYRIAYFKNAVAALALQLRREQVRLLDRDEARIKETSLALAQQVEQAWREFSSRAG